MAYDIHLAERIEQALTQRKVAFRTIKMMGGLCFMVDEKMCVGIVKDQLMARIGEENMEQMLQREGAIPMDFTGKPLKGFIYVKPEGFDFETDFDFWINACLAYNPLAKASKKR